MDIFVALNKGKTGETSVQYVSRELADVEQLIEHHITNRVLKRDRAARCEAETFDYPETITVDFGTIPFDGVAIIERYTVTHEDGTTEAWEIYRKKDFE